MEGVTLLEDVENAANEMHQHRERADAARELLYAAVRRAHGEGIPAARIARAARLSAERVRQIVREES